MRQFLPTVIGLILCTGLHAATIAVQTQPVPNHQLHTANKTVKQPTFTPPMPPRVDIKAKAWVLMDAQSGKILAQHNDQLRLPPASLTKLMTAYVVLQALHNGTIHLDDQVLISRAAAKTGGSRMFIRAGKRISVENLIKGMIIASSNDATIALADHVAGTTVAFAHLMNQTAAQLGMHHSHFVNQNGLPAKDQYVSALDMAILARALIQHFPQAYHWYSTKTFTWNGIKQRSRNRLLWTNPHVDGLKTGYTKAAQYCLVASAKRDNMRLIGVVLGAASANSRTIEMQKLLTYGFRFYQVKTLYKAQQTIETVPVENGRETQVPVTVTQPIVVTIPRGRAQQLTAKLSVNTLEAPIQAGQVVGKIHVDFHQKPIITRDIVAQKAIAKATLWQKVKRWF